MAELQRCLYSELLVLWDWSRA